MTDLYMVRLQSKTKEKNLQGMNKKNLIRIFFEVLFYKQQTFKPKAFVGVFYYRSITHKQKNIFAVLKEMKVAKNSITK